MAIVVAGIIGGAIVGIGTIAANYSDYSDHYSDYSDYEYQRRKALREAKERRFKEAKQDLDETIGNTVSVFTRDTDIKVPQTVSSDSCNFKNFTQDMKPMDDSAKKAIEKSVQDDTPDDSQQQEELKAMDAIIAAIDRALQPDNPPQKNN